MFHATKRLARVALLSAVAAFATQSARAAIFNEIEPNETRPTATLVAGMLAGDMIVGNSQGTATTAGITSLDQFRVTTGALPIGIYQHRLTLTSTIAGHTGSIRGFGQTGAPVDTLAGTPWDGVVGASNTTDTAMQTSSTATTPARFNQWYGFGKAESFYYRVTGAAATTADYTATMTSTPVVATPIGAYAPGQINITTFGQGHTSDTEMWIYDSNLSAIAGYGNDDEAVAGGSPGTGATGNSWLSRSYAPGTYYIALSTFAMALNQGSPSDDDFRTGSTLDFPDIIAASSTTLNVNTQFQITDSLGGTLQVPNTKVGAYDINWFTFTVVPEPTSLAVIGLAGLGLAARRRR